MRIVARVFASLMCLLNSFPTAAQRFHPPNEGHRLTSKPPGQINFEARLEALDSAVDEFRRQKDTNPFRAESIKNSYTQEFLRTYTGGMTAQNWVCRVTLTVAEVIGGYHGILCKSPTTYLILLDINDERARSVLVQSSADHLMTFSGQLLNDVNIVQSLIDRMSNVHVAPMVLAFNPPNQKPVPEHQVLYEAQVSQLISMSTRAQQENSNAFLKEQLMKDLLVLHGGVASAQRQIIDWSCKTTAIGVDLFRYSDGANSQERINYVPTGEYGIECDGQNRIRYLIVSRERYGWLTELKFGDQIRFDGFGIGRRLFDHVTIVRANSLRGQPEIKAG